MWSSHTIPTSHADKAKSVSTEARHPQTVIANLLLHMEKSSHRAYAWLSSDRLIVVQTPRLFDNGSKVSAHVVVVRAQGISLRRIATATVADLSKSLTSALSDYQIGLHPFIAYVSTSPSRHGLLIRTHVEEGSGAADRMGFVSLERSYHWTQKNAPGNWIWLDVTHWLGCMRLDPSTIQLFCFDLPTRTISKLGQKDSVKVDAYKPSKLINPVPLFVRPNGAVLIGLFDTSEAIRERFDLLSVGIEPGATANRHIAVRIPMDRLVADVAASKDGRSLAWILLSSSGTNAEIWTSKQDGAAFRCLGSLPLTPFERTGELDEVEGLAWSPSGKWLTFLYRNSLWSTRVSK